MLDVGVGNRGSTPLASKSLVINYLQRLDDNRCDNMSIVVRYCPQGFMRICLHFAGLTRKKRATTTNLKSREPGREV